MRQTPTFSMSRRMVQAIAQTAGRRSDSMSGVVRSAVRMYLGLDDDDRPLRPSALPGRDREAGFISSEPDRADT